MSWCNWGAVIDEAWSRAGQRGDLVMAEWLDDLHPISPGALEASWKRALWAGDWTTADWIWARGELSAEAYERVWRRAVDRGRTEALRWLCDHHPPEHLLQLALETGGPAAKVVQGWWRQRRAKSARS